jgi:hypothetical protein
MFIGSWSPQMKNIFILVSVSVHLLRLRIIVAVTVANFIPVN